eukprot:4560510-Amphidinium_carterae.1
MQKWGDPTNQNGCLNDKEQRQLLDMWTWKLEPEKSAEEVWTQLNNRNYYDQQLSDHKTPFLDFNAFLKHPDYNLDVSQNMSYDLLRLWPWIDQQTTERRREGAHSTSCTSRRTTTSSTASLLQRQQRSVLNNGGMQRIVRSPLLQSTSMMKIVVACAATACKTKSGSLTSQRASMDFALRCLLHNNTLMQTT